MAFSAKQMEHNFSKGKKPKKKAKKVRIDIISPTKRRPAIKTRENKEIIIINQGGKVATKTRKTRRKSVVKRATRSVSKVAKRVYRKSAKRVKRYSRKVKRSIVSHSGGIVTTNKKETLINLGCIGAGFIGTMALMNLAPIPSQIKNAKWKGGALAAITILLALKVKDKKARLALAGSAVYGLVDLARQYIPQLAKLSGYDSERAMILSGAISSRGALAVGGSRGRSIAVGGNPTKTANPALVHSMSASTYPSAGSFTTKTKY